MPSAFIAVSLAAGEKIILHDCSFVSSNIRRESIQPNKSAWSGNNRTVCSFLSITPSPPYVTFSSFFVSRERQKRKKISDNYELCGRVSACTGGHSHTYVGEDLSPGRVCVRLDASQRYINSIPLWRERGIATARAVDMWDFDERPLTNRKGQTHVPGRFKNA